VRVLFDTNVVLDVLLNRLPWVTDSAAVWQASDEGRIIGHIVASTLTDIFYVIRRQAGAAAAQAAVQICLRAFEICPVDRQAVVDAVALSGNDFEDNLQIACAARANLDAIVTRNKQDFQASTIGLVTPSELLAALP
jgi:predicted nucleic acid-binding protein